MEKKYAVQYAYDNGIHTSGYSSSNIKIVVDTNPIPYEEAISIFKSHIKDFILRYKEDQRPQLVLWDDVGDGQSPNYHTELIELYFNDTLEFQGDKIYKIINKKEEIIIPN